MTDKEIKLEIAKAVIVNGGSIEYAEKFYQWVLNEKIPVPVEDYPVSVLKRIPRVGSTIEVRCRENHITTIGELFIFGAHKFRTLPYIGRRTITLIDDFLEEKYNIKDFYKS